MPLTASDVIAIVAIMGGGALLSTLINYIVQRPKLRAQQRISNLTEPAEVGRAYLAELESRLAYLNGIIESLKAENSRLQANYQAEMMAREMERTRNEELRRQYYELAERLDKTEWELRELRRQLGIQRPERKNELPKPTDE